MEQNLTHAGLLAALDWQIELGADEAIGDAPLDRYAQSEAEKARKLAARQKNGDPRGQKKGGNSAPIQPAPAFDPVAAARSAAGAADSLEELQAAMAAFEHCDLKRGAKNLVFADGQPAARVMIVGEAPGRDEDIQGKPFVGRAGQLLNAMFAAIEMGRDHADPENALYITNVLPWRPPQNRDPSPEEVAMMRPFLERHIELANPDVLVLMGNPACQAMLGRQGITRLRGNWTEVLNIPALPMFHPAYLLRTPSVKRQAWSDLLTLLSRLREKR